MKEKNYDQYILDTSRGDNESIADYICRMSKLVCSPTSEQEALYRKEHKHQLMMLKDLQSKAIASRPRKVKTNV